MSHRSRAVWSFSALPLAAASILTCGHDAREAGGASSASTATTEGPGATGATAATGATGASGAQSGSGGGGPSASWSYYGVPWAADSLSNWNIGSTKHQRWSYRFAAAKSGTIEYVRVFFIPNPIDHSKTGYSDGTGGAVHAELCVDDGTALHAPDCTTPLGSVDKSDFGLVGGFPQPGYDQKNTDFPKLAFPSAIPVTEGTLYHVVFSNIDPTPDDNWISLDGLVESNGAPAAVRPSFTEWGLLLGDLDAGTWTDWTSPDGVHLNTPVMAVGYSDAYAFGCGYMEVWPTDAQARAIDGTGSVRERFTASRDLTVSGIGVRAKRTAGGGTLVAKLETDAGDFVDEATIEGADVPSDRHGWVDASFAMPRELMKGASYLLVLEAEGGGSFLAHCVRDGQTWTFEPGSVFSDGYAEFDRGDGLGFLGWYGYSDAGDPDYKDGDLQLYFTTQ